MSLSELEPWIADNKLPFFPEYTDHGPDHINEVFVTAEALIRDDAWPHITPEDVTVLVLAILLHDCAMHLSENGFLALLEKKEWARPVVAAIDTTTWPDLWDEFLREAARFDGKKLKKLFGDTEPAKPPPLDVLKMTKRDHLLIGEFMRRHHPRLAHEIALRGVPGPTTTLLKLQNIEGKLADLAGLVARSHGIGLRAATELLPADERRETKNVHAPFLMSVLRVADYLQIHAERAPKKLLQVKELRSPVSIGEWKKHDAIETIHNRHDDPEALYVKALPQDGPTYVALKWLFGSIQGELDDVWAVLGEVYGRVEDLRDLGIAIRRLRSNLDNEKEFAKTVDFVPGQAEFQTAGADLLKLLVGPLYGDEPEIGIREMLQNAVDACRELEDYLKRHPGAPMPVQTEQEADVVISHHIGDDGAKWITVSDRGIGMTPDVVKNYFLRAGASFRNSETWRKHHTDDGSKSRILRSGRFGVGVLAAFLLGDTIRVSTRHVSEQRGVEFAATIDDDVLSLRYVDRTIGTTVSIRAASDAIENGSKEGDEDDYDDGDLAQVVRDADWYCLERPSVLRQVTDGASDHAERFSQRVTYPAPNAQLGCEWRRISHPDYADIQWSFWQKDRTSMFACNGIRIPETSLIDSWLASSALELAQPAISVFDPDGHLPLTLRRDSIDPARVSFLDALSDDIWRDFAAHALVSLGPGIDVKELAKTTEGDLAYPGVIDASRRLGEKGRSWFRFWVTPHGWSVADPWFFKEMRLRSLVFVNIPQFNSSVGSLRGHATGRIICRCHGHQAHAAWVRAVVLGDSHSVLGPASYVRPHGVRVLLQKHRYDELREPKRIAREVWAKLAVEYANDRWVIVRGGECPTDSELLHRLNGDAAKDQFESLAEWYVRDGLFHDEYVSESPLSRLARIWADVVKIPYIPFDIDERRRVLTSAYERLAPYIAAHEELLKKGATTLAPTTEDSEGAEE